MVVVNGPIRNEIGMNCGIGAMGPYNHANATIGRAYGLLSQNCQGGSEPGRHLHGLAGQQLHLQQHHLRGERGAQPLGAAARAEGLQADRLHGERVLRLPLDHLLPRPAREILARARQGHARRHRRQLRAVPDPRSDHGAAVHRPRRLPQEGRPDPLGARERADAGRPLLGPAARAELRLSLGDLRQGADGDLAQGQASTS